MEIVHFKDIPGDERPDGRTVKKLLSHKFSKPIESIAIYICDVPKGQFGAHYHEEGGEVIMFPKGGKIEVNKKEYTLEPWDFVVLAPGDVHGFKGETQDTMHLAIKFQDVDDKVSVD